MAMSNLTPSIKDEWLASVKTMAEEQLRAHVSEHAEAGEAARARDERGALHAHRWIREVCQGELDLRRMEALAA